MDPSLDLSKLTDADKADLQQQLANEQQKATIQQSKWTNYTRIAWIHTPVLKRMTSLLR